MAIVKKFLEVVVSLFFKIFFQFHKERAVPKDLKRAIGYYKRGDFSDLFAKVRAWDAPYEAIERLAPQKGVIVDLGCGDGLLANFLGLSNPERKVYGIELNKERIKKANNGVKNVIFSKGDVLRKKIPKNDGSLLVHVLHHLPSKKSQEDLLKRVYESLNKNGKLIIVEVAEKPLKKLIFSWLTDAFTVPILFERKLFDFNFYYRKINGWKKVLFLSGFRSVEIKAAPRGMPFSHVVFVCRKV